MKLNLNEKQYIAQRFRNGELPEDIAIDVGISVNAVKRALADVKEISLSWYKTKDQHALLERLEKLGIHSVTGLNNHLNKLTFGTNPLNES